VATLVLNHAFLEGLAFAPAEEIRGPLVEITQTVLRARRARGGVLLYVHSELGTTDVGDGESFVRWANARVRNPKWRDLLQPLLQFGSGPFVSDLERDEGPVPTESLPSCDAAPTWLQETLLLTGHHVLSCRRDAWLISYGVRPYLTDAHYRFNRADAWAKVDNFRSDGDAARAEAALVVSTTSSASEILDRAAQLSGRVIVLDSARRAAERWVLDCTFGRLLEALVGLDVYARALEGGASREAAAETYQQATSIEMSQEKANTLKKPTLRSQRTFRLPDGTREVFDMHAKPGAMTRIHIYARREVRSGRKAGAEEIVVYVGHCGRHLDLK
jgi:hypothetical protein